MNVRTTITREAHYTRLSIPDKRLQQLVGFGRDKIWQPKRVHFTNKRRRTRAVRGVCRDCRTGEWFIEYYGYRYNVCRARKSDVTPESWADIISPRVKRAVRRKPEQKLTGYNLKKNYCTLVKSDGGKFHQGCQTFTKARIIAVCRAILEDEGYEVKQS